ncbi:HAD family hydrolase [Thalassobacillus hwangdonensis]|uniref:HAD family hydrolase n=1 Tax=Thalassobacillus hwangdonensis TaxID=546108 RepID=A0ABW3KW16_9BACI
MTLNEAPCLIFDLDGTLYEDTDHFDYYAAQLKEKLPADKKAEFEADYHSILNGAHPLTIGKAYDIEHDAILTLDPFTNKVTEAHTWEGEMWNQTQIEKAYPEALSYDFERMIAIGDGWWLPFSAAVHHGLHMKDTYHCYVKTKEYMVSEEFQLTQTPGLKDWLTKWKEEKHLILMTNSEAYDVENLLRELELEGLFHEVITSAQKPSMTDNHFDRVLKELPYKPEEIISIGDNFINEVAPALQKGMHAIFIQPRPVTIEHERLHVVKSLQELL